MTDLLAARTQMAWSLGFHIVFAAIGMTMPFFMATSHFLWLKKKQKVYRDLTLAWSRGVAIFFAVGAVSGTVLSFELGLLWPAFMKEAGAVIGMPFSWEGAAFFLEAIALGLFLYGWERIPKWTHWWTGVLVGVSGVASGIFVVCANAWMNSPAGFSIVDGKFTDIDPWKAMFNPAWLSMGIHTVFASFIATGFAVAGFHAALVLRGKAVSFHRKAMKIPLGFATIAVLLQIVSGDLLAKQTAERQPAKLAAMEAHFDTGTRAPILIGGWANEESGTVDYAFKIPGMLSWLAKGDMDASVQGLRDIPRELWPPVNVVHLSFQIMVGIGTLLALVGSSLFFGHFRFPRLLEHEVALRVLALCTPLGFLALEAGWITTEVGRQPWIIQGVMKTADAVTRFPGLGWSLAMYGLVYVGLAILCAYLLWRQVLALETEEGA